MSQLVLRLQEALADRYTVEREIGSGGMAHVLLAEDRKHHRKVAIKVLRPDIGSAVGAERFLREIEIAAQLSHPHILPLHDSGSAGDLLYYVMPFVEGESLRDRLRRTGTVPLTDALRIAQDVASALAYAHKRNVIHRDIKPENILLSEGHAVVADFGIARALSAAGGDRLTSTGIAIGTIHYMSPEQALGETVDGRADIYSLGTVLYEMLAGQTPHHGETARAIMSRLIAEPAPRLETTRPEIPPHVARVVDRTLAKDPAERYATGSDLADALASVAASASAPTPVPAARRSRRVPIAAGIALVLAPVAWLVFQQTRAPGTVGPESRIAVLPFTVHGGAHADYLGEGIVDLLSRNLEGVEDVSSIDPATVMSAVGRGSTTGAGIDVPAGRAFGRRVGAGSFVLGSVTSSGPTLRLQAAMYPADGNGEPIARASAEGDSARLLELVDRLAGQLLVNRRRDAANRLNQTAALTTHSLGALKAFLNAERNLRARAADSAIAGYQQAIALDSTFALAYYRLAVAAGWSERHAVSSDAVARGLRHSERLGERDRLLVRAYADYRRGAADEAEQQYRAILDNYPDDLEAEFQLGDLLYQYNPLRGRPRLEARPLLDKVLALDPGFL